MGIELFKKKRFEQEMVIHLDTLYRFALSLCGVPADAEDLVQETMMKAYRSYDRFKTNTNAKAWLMTILRNTFLNTKRGTGRPGFFIWGELETFAGQSNTARDAEARQDANLAMEALNNLPEDFRTPIVLCDVEDFSYQEIANVMNCPIGTVMSRLYRGRRMLRKALLQEHKVINFSKVKNKVHNEL